MSGRGGKGTSLTHEQLQALGCLGKDMPAVTSVVPPTFPPLLSKPVQKEITATQDFKILWKEAFLNHMRDSCYFTVPKSEKDSQSYSDEVQSALESTKDKPSAEFPWKLMPNELAPQWKKRKQQGNSQIKKKKVRTENIVAHLKNLEDQDKSDEEQETAIKKSESDDEAEEILEEDEEMDDENDYGENYFDNGEAYNEEDDNLDDGPVY
uniref:DNA-directed RNA polymerase III subunit n=1 Tax=Megaselia scalaris TaxID=36166 RepID=T1GG79_MEGSC